MKVSAAKTLSIIILTDEFMIPNRLMAHTSLVKDVGQLLFFKSHAFFKSKVFTKFMEISQFNPAGYIFNLVESAIIIWDMLL